MKISKESEITKLLEVVYKNDDVKNFYISLRKGVGLIAKIEDISGGTTTVKITDSSVDYSFDFSSRMVAGIILNSIYNDTDIPFAQLTVDSLNLDDNITAATGALISFSKEQFENLEKDFVFTSGNYYIHQKLFDVIIFIINEGKVYEYCPGVRLLKVSNLNATLDSATIEQTYGHSFVLYGVINKIIFDILKGKDRVDFFLDGSYKFVSDNTVVEYTVSDFNISLEMAKQYVSNRNTEADKTIPFSVLKNIYNKIHLEYIPDTEKISMYVEKEDGHTSINIENLYKIPADDISIDFSFGTDYRVLDWIIYNLPENTEVSLMNSLIRFKSGDEYYFTTSFIN